jgi:hypothetical protein
VLNWNETANCFGFQYIGGSGEVECFELIHELTNEIPHGTCLLCRLLRGFKHLEDFYDSKKLAGPLFRRKNGRLPNSWLSLPILSVSSLTMSKHAVAMLLFLFMLEACHIARGAEKGTAVSCDTFSALNHTHTRRLIVEYFLIRFNDF